MAQTNNPAEGAKWTLTDAYGITNEGLVTGHGIYYGPDGVSQGDQAFLLDVRSILPEPSSIALLAVGILGSVVCVGVNCNRIGIRTFSLSAQR
jgi:hypothetical protein